MQFDGRRARFDVTYQLLQNFARRLNMPFDTGINQINIIELRGAKPVHGGNTVSTFDQVNRLIWDYDALHDVQVNWPRLASQFIDLITEIIDTDTDYFNAILQRRQGNNIVQRMQSMCRAIVDLDTTRERQFSGTAREIEQEVDRLDLVNKEQRIVDNQVRDYSCQLELADNVVDRYNDTIILVWKDSRNNPHIRVLLGSIDPGSHWIENPMDNHPGTAVIGQGNYQARWVLHNGTYSALNLQRNGTDVIGGSRITDYHRDEGDIAGNDRARRADDTITITEYTYYDTDDDHALSGINVHAGGFPDRIIHRWSAGCTVICGSQFSDDPANTYDQIFGTNDLGNQNTWLGIDPVGAQATFNVIVWDAWSLYRLFLGRDFKPNLQIGAADITQNLYPGENAEQWVDRMQEGLNSKTERIRAFNQRRNEITRLFNQEREQLHEDYPLFIPEDIDFPELNGIDANGIFDNATASALRNFQLVCFVLLGDGNIRLQLNNINRDELMWERNQWMCGPETWKLLEARNFVIVNVLLQEQQRALEEWGRREEARQNHFRMPWEEEMQR
jgi:hypothetical protein